MHTRSACHILSAFKNVVSPKASVSLFIAFYRPSAYRDDVETMYVRKHAYHDSLNASIQSVYRRHAFARNPTDASHTA